MLTDLSDDDLSHSIFESARKSGIEIPIHLWRQYERLKLSKDIQRAGAMFSRGGPSSSCEEYTWMYLVAGFDAVTRGRLCPENRFLAARYRFVTRCDAEVDVIAALISVDPHLNELMKSFLHQEMYG